jgi:hypothetical protein
LTGGDKLKIIIVGLAVAGPLMAASSTLAQSCKSGPPLNVVRVDEKSTGVRRIFVQEAPEFGQKLKSRSRALEYVRRVQRWVRVCKHQWGDDWQASLFSDARYAGYKDEKRVEPFLINGTWARNYLAEYDNRSGVFTLYPLLPEKMLVHRFGAPKKSYQ